MRNTGTGAPGKADPVVHGSADVCAGLFSSSVKAATPQRYARFFGCFEGDILR